MRISNISLIVGIIGFLAIFLLFAEPDASKESDTQETTSLARVTPEMRAKLAQARNDPKFKELPLFEGDPIPEFKGLTVFNKKAANPGVTLYATSGSETIKLLNFDGTPINTWKNIDADRVRLMPGSCNVLAIHGSKWGGQQTKWRRVRHIIREYDWNGKVVWEHKAKKRAHHDVRRLENGNTLYLRRTIVIDGVKERITDPERRELALESDSLVEVTPDGEIVWEWHGHDHFDWNKCGREECRAHHFIRGKKKESSWLHMNTIGIVPQNKWFDQGDARFKPGNIFIIPRNFSEVYLIDKESKQIVWQYGGEDFSTKTQDYGGIIRGHEAHMIPKGYPGAGNVLLIDNGAPKKRAYSIIREVNPTTNKVVWHFEDKKFYTHGAGSVQRLKNGNTFFSEDYGGRAVEITPKKQVVWEYRDGYRINRAHRYDFDHCEKLAAYAKN